jgi:hypothetical protein
MVDPDILMAEFGTAATKASIAGWRCPLRCETLPAPHRPPPLPRGDAAVYVFAISAAYGRSAPCGPGTVLKVGKVGPNSEPRFRYQHYNPRSAGSNVAKSLIANSILWPWLGIKHLDADTVANWMLSSLNRTHFFIPGGLPQVLATLEIYTRARVGSVFEGA